MVLSRRRCDMVRRGSVNSSHGKEPDADFSLGLCHQGRSQAILELLYPNTKSVVQCIFVRRRQKSPYSVAQSYVFGGGAGGENHAHAGNGWGRRGTGGAADIHLDVFGEQTFDSPGCGRSGTQEPSSVHLT